MILVTGGAGYIGSHTCVELLQAGQDVTVFDNFCNSHPAYLERVQRITGKQLRIIRGDIRDQAALVTAIRESGAHAVIHLPVSLKTSASICPPHGRKRQAQQASEPAPPDQQSIQTIAMSPSTTIVCYYQLIHD